MVDYIEALKYPILDIKNFLMGFILGVFWFLLFPIIFIFGYMVETIRETLQQSNKLPHWFTLENWKIFLKHGFFVIIIGLVYLLPPLVLSVASSTLLGNPLATIASGSTPTLNTLGVSLSILSAIMFLVAIFLLPMAIILYSASEDIRYAISLSEILPRIRRALIPYLKAYAISLGVYLLFALLLFVPFLGFLFGGIMFYPFLFSARLFAEVFREYE